MRWLDLAIGILATWRLTALVVDDEGPFSLLSRLRQRLDPSQATWVGRGVRCYWCVSFWLAWPVTGVLAAGYGWLLLPLACSGAVMVLQAWMVRGGR